MTTFLLLRVPESFPWELKVENEMPISVLWPPADFSDNLKLLSDPKGQPVALIGPGNAVAIAESNKCRVQLI